MNWPAGLEVSTAMPGRPAGMQRIGCRCSRQISSSIARRRKGKRYTSKERLFASLGAFSQAFLIGSGSRTSRIGFGRPILVAYPPRKPMRWNDADIDPDAEDGIARLIDRLYELPPPRCKWRPIPVTVRLSPEGDNSLSRTTTFTPMNRWTSTAILPPHGRTGGVWGDSLW